MSTITQDFSKRDLERFSEQLKNTRAAYDKEEEAATAAGLLFTWFGIIGGPAGVCVTAGILATVLAVYYDTVQNTITSAVEAVDRSKDFLQDNPEYNLIRLEITYETKEANNVKYNIPTNFNTVAVHCINPPGWSMF